MTLQTPWQPLEIGASFDAQFSTDETRLVVVGRALTVWDLPARNVLYRTHPFSHPADACFSPNGNVIAVKNTAGRIITLDAPSGAVIRDFRDKSEGEGTRVAFSPCGAYLVDASRAGVISVRRADTGDVVFRRSLGGSLIKDLAPIDGGKRWVLVHGEGAPDASSPPPPRHIDIWDWPFDAGPSSVWRTDMSFLRDWAISPAGAMIATVDGAPPERIRVFSVATKNVLGEARIDSNSTGTGRMLAWSGDGTRLYSIELDDFAAYELSDMHLKRVKRAEFYYAAGVTVSKSLIALSSWESGFIVDAADIPDCLSKVPEEQPDWYRRRKPD
jgi:WD40 repeat protein